MTNLPAVLDRIKSTSITVRGLILFAFGGCTTLAMPPTAWWLILWLSLPAFIILLRTARNWKQAIVFGWLFGFGFFSFGYAWMVNAFFVDRQTYAALALPAIGGLAAGFALYIGLCALALQVISPAGQNKTPRTQAWDMICSIVVFSSIWAIIEWFRGWFLTGLPWNTIGSTWSNVTPVLQTASLFGVFGLSLITVLAAASPALLARSSDRGLAFKAVVIFHLPLLAATIWGAFRLEVGADEFVENIMFRLVQPNIAQEDKWRPTLREQHLTDQVALSIEGAQAVTHVLWAETSAPFALNRHPQIVSFLARGVPRKGYLLTGAPRFEGRGYSQRAFNSLYAISEEGIIQATYDKSRLVPFGEYMPLQNLIPIPNLTRGTGWTEGTGVQTINLPGLPSFSPLICYEVIFPGAVTRPDERPKWLFNLTNDAWFGLSNGPYQHLSSAQLRAVEEGLPLVRVANTGVSAVFDPYGRVIARLPLGQSGYIDSRLPQPLEPTMFSRLGHGPFLLLSLLLAGAAFFISRKTLD
ncbi:MAG: apolipoprotein N-acyltransferase [Rhodospirillaceae bacterium]